MGNGHQLPPLDLTGAVADIGDYLKAGKNSVEIIVSTTLGNAIRPLTEELLSSGTTFQGPAPLVEADGLVSPVLVMPYTVIK